MSGHSKWSSIKHKKGAADAKRGAIFTKLANMIAVAARSGADPDTNFKLRLAINKAKAASMPVANIDRAIKRGAGLLEGTQMEEIMYEGYGPDGIAILVEAATDNRNRTGAEVRTAFSKHGGRMGESGSVAYLFDHRGRIVITATDLEGAEMAAIEAGADDIEESDGELIIYTAPTQLDAVRKALSEAGYEVTDAELTFIPKSTTEVTDIKTAATLMRLFDALEESDDITATYANFDMSDELMEQAAA